MILKIIFVPFLILFLWFIIIFVFVDVILYTSTNYLIPQNIVNRINTAFTEIDKFYNE